MARSPMQAEYQAAVKRIMRKAARVTDADWALGDRWYDGERAWIAGVADATGHSVDAACTAFAALSPRAQYGANRTGLIDLCNGRPVRRCLPVQVECAKLVLADHTRFESYKGCGPKTLRFARNLNGCLDSVTVDVWMMRVVGSELDAPSSPRHYDRIERAFQGAAGRLGVSPRTLQAALWFHVRGDKPTDPDWRP